MQIHAPSSGERVAVVLPQRDMLDICDGAMAD